MALSPGEIVAQKYRVERLLGEGGMGAVYAAELGRDSIPVRNEILANGVIVRPIGTCLAICPPLVITDDEVGRVIDTMAAALR